MADILFTPTRECVAATNVWGFLHWLRTVHGTDLADWATLQNWSADRPANFRVAMGAFARLPDQASHLIRHTGAQEALAVRRTGGLRHAYSRDELLRSATPAAALPAEFSGPLARPCPPAQLVRPLADLLLHADLRPDDRLLVIGPPWPWLAALMEGTAVIFADATADSLPRIAQEERATVLVAPAQTLAGSAFQSRRRPDLANLRTIIATGGPLSPPARRRVYTWVKPDVLLLARAGDVFWGNPLEPVLVRPHATPAFLTPPTSGPAKR